MFIRGGPLLGMIVPAGIEIVVGARARGFVRDHAQRIETGAQESFESGAHER